MKRILILALTLLFSFHLHGSENASRQDLSELKEVIIQDGGRKKPLFTFARETLLALSGRTSLTFDNGETVDAMEFIVASWLSAKSWAHHPVIALDHAATKERLGLDGKARRHTFHSIVSSPSFTALAAEVEQAKEAAGGQLSDGDDRKVEELLQRLALFRSVHSGALFAVVPHPSDERGRWVTLPEADAYYSGEALEGLRRATGRLYSTYRGLDSMDTLSAAAVEFLRVQRELSPDVMPAAGRISVEVLYEQTHPFRLAWIFALLSGLATALSWSAYRKPGMLLGWIFAGGAVVLLVLAMGARVYISGRAPVTNMYETVVWVGLGLLVFGMIFEARYRCRYFLASAAPTAALFLLIADSVPVILDPSISPLTPVLRDNFWLTTHVLTVTISYAAFALAFALGHVVLGQQIIRGGRSPVNENLYAYVYRAMQIGIFLLATGVILGAVWANYSWGRFWDWDPKETWSLIALMIYLFLLHGRLVGWWRGFGFSVGAVLGFQGILMCWYGVNFILGAGLHSYGFGTGGTGYVVSFVIVEFVFVAVAVFRRYYPGDGGSFTERKIGEKDATLVGNR